jgi:hypothetical protein
VLEFLDLNQDKDKVRYMVKTASTVKSVFIFKYGIADLALGAPDKLSATVSGASGVTGSVDIANVMQPVALEAGKGTVQAGLPGQSIGDISVAEQRSGALRAQDASGNRAKLELKLPQGFRFAELPTVTVSDGNLSLDKTGISIDSDRVLVIPVEKSGTAPSTIKITGIKLDVDRTVPEDNVKMEVEGTAVSETGSIFTNNDHIDLVVASCATPAEPATGSAVFKIDRSSYTVNGQDVQMDVAPYIKNGRTMLPLRFAATAVGVADGNISWDEQTGTVTLIKSNRVVKMQIGNSAMQLNGVSISIDAAPEISGGRTMVPIRALGTALGATLQWNESEQTVTVKAG